MVADKTASQVRAEVTRRIQTLGRANKPREAVLQLAEMAKLGVQPDTQAATALIDACARNGNMDMAQSVFDELFGMLSVYVYQASHVPIDPDGFLQPDDITFSVLVRGYGEVRRRPCVQNLLHLNLPRQTQLQPPQWSSISALLNTMQRKYSLEPGVGA